MSNYSFALSIREIASLFVCLRTWYFIIVMFIVVVTRRIFDYKRRQAALALKLVCNSSVADEVGGWSDAGITSAARPWTLSSTIIGTVLGLIGLTFSLPVLVPMSLLITIAEALRHAVGLHPCYVSDSEEGDEEQLIFVIPGTCMYVFWQLGMVQYLCEQFDTREIKLAGISSGAVCASFILLLESAAEAGDRRSAGERVRRQAHGVFKKLEAHLSAVSTWPLAFVMRLGAALDLAHSDIFQNDVTADVGNRISIGIRRLAGWWIPALVPDSVIRFRSGEDFVKAIAASSHVWLVIRPTFTTYLMSKGAYCSDGVNPFSFYCFLEYLVQLRRGITERTAPAYTQNGLDMIYALWNCGVMRVLLPRKGSFLWVSPTVGGKLDLRYSLRNSGWWTAEQWRRGYAHARELDEQGYWHRLSRWKTGHGGTAWTV